MAGKRSTSAKEKWKDENVHRLLGPKQILQEGPIPATKNRHLRRQSSRMQTLLTFGLFLRIPSNLAQKRRWREDKFYYSLRSILLYKNARRTKTTTHTWNIDSLRRFYIQNVKRWPPRNYKRRSPHLSYFLYFLYISCKRACTLFLTNRAPRGGEVFNEAGPM